MRQRLTYVNDYNYFDYNDIYRLRKISPPQTHFCIPPSFLIRVHDPENFIPYNMVNYFNEKIFYNLLHRECFNACIDNSDSKQCYLNCRSKHLTSIELFKKTIEEHRKYKPIDSYVNLEEYQKRPKDMGKEIPKDSDYYAKEKYYRDQFLEELPSAGKGLDRIFQKASKDYSVQKTNIFKLYVSGLFPPRTQKAIERNNTKERYQEYVKLNEEYGSKLDELLNSKESEFNWGHIQGDDYKL